MLCNMRNGRRRTCSDQSSLWSCDNVSIDLEWGNLLHLFEDVSKWRTIFNKSESQVTSRILFRLPICMSGRYGNFASCRMRGQSLMRAAMSQLNLSARAYHRILKLARTIAHLAEALHASQSPEVEDGIMLGEFHVSITISCLISHNYQKWYLRSSDRYCIWGLTHKVSALMISFYY